MSKIRVYELAKELTKELGTQIEPKDVLARAGEVGLRLDNHLSQLDADAVSKVRKLFEQPRDGDMVEQRVAPTVIRRRRRTSGEEDAPAASQTGSTTPATAPATTSTPVRRRAEPSQVPSEPMTVVLPPSPAVPEPEPAPEPIATVVDEVAQQPPIGPFEPELDTSSPSTTSTQRLDVEGSAPAPAEPSITSADLASVAQTVVVQPEVVQEPAEPEVAPEPPRNVEPLRLVTELPPPPTPSTVPGRSDVDVIRRRPDPRRTALRVDPQGRPTETRAVVVAPPPPGFQPPRPPPGSSSGAVGQSPGGRGGYGAEPYRPTQGMPGGGGPTERFARPAPPAAPPPPPLTPSLGKDLETRKGVPKKRGKRIVEQKGWNLRLAVDEDFGTSARRGGGSKKAAKRPKPQKTQITVPKAAKRVVKLEDVISVSELAQQMSVKAGEVIKSLMKMGVMATVNQVLDVDTATLIAEEFSFTVENRGFDLTDYVPDQESNDEDLEPRPPVVTIMGHVDHGKTSLLDYIRKTKVAAGEAGGITQHIGAYMVEGTNGRVTFLDTPGHEAFTAMRARGADVTDIVILVVAADDGVMPQTAEAISHAREAEVPIIVAVNKIDKPNARLDMVLNQLAERGLTPEDWGGDTIVCKVSAHTGEGIDQLIEMLALQSDVLELKANYKRPARGVVIESQLDKGRGPVATVLINDGVLKVGDYVVSGTAFGRVRALNDFAGRRIQSAGPAEPVEVLGLSGVANASEPLYVVEDEKKARTIVNHRQMKEREKQLVRPVRASLQDLFQQIQAGETEQLKIILKADVQGSVEALTAALKEIHHADVEVKIIHEGVGGITDSDVNLASASNAIVIGFNVRTEASARAIADQEGVTIKIYNVIYDVLDDVKKGMEGLLEPTIEEKDLGRAEIREVFSTPKAGNIAGCMVLKGSVKRGGLARLYRDNIRIWEGKIGSLRRFKNDAREVQEGFECGIGLDGYNDIKIGDIIETFERIEVAQRIN